MANYGGKIFGAIVGWALARLDGAIVGLLIGGVLDEYMSVNVKVSRGSATSGNPANFHYNLLVLSAAVMQSDGKTTRSELDYVRDFFIRQFGVEKTKEDLLALREILKRKVSVDGITLILRQRMEYQGRLQLLHYLFGVAYADGVLSSPEKAILIRIATLLGITPVDLSSIAAMFGVRGGSTVINTSAAYEILGIKQDATEDEIKKAYRHMAMQHHPDKVSHLGEEVRKDAEEKFKKIQEAYESIKQVKGFA